MLEWLGDEGEQMRIAFTKVFGSLVRPFGSPALQLGGISDGREGVQWNVAYDPLRDRRWAGVNLEGMEYDEWPVARLIERELKEPRLPSLLRDHSSLSQVVLVWRRDYWQASARPRIIERNISPTPIELGKLTKEDWRHALQEALECLDPRRKRRGRARQTVTLESGKRIEGDVSPHLMLRYMATDFEGWEPFLREARQRLQPLHDWASSRAAKPIRF
jgi:hypothetical protein